MGPYLTGRLNSYLVRGFWVLLVLFSAGLFVAGIPYRYAELLGPCTLSPADCANLLSPTALDIIRLNQDGLTPQTFAAVWLFAAVGSAAIMWAVGLLILTRKHADPGAIVISTALIVLSASSPLSDALARQVPLFHTPAQLLSYLRLLFFPFFFAAFPNGRIIPRVMWLVIGFWAIRSFITTFLPDLTVGIYATLTDLSWMVMFLSGIAAQVYRYARVSTTDERKQTKWVVLGLGVFVALLLVSISVFGRANLEGVSSARLAFEVFQYLAILLIPGTLFIAVLRNRLWNIDLIIRRTLIYSLVTALLALVYFGGVIILQQLFRSLTGAGGDLAIILSTLSIYALFTPLRIQIQNVIDRRFYRSRYDAQRVLSGFARTARDETNLEKLTHELINVVDGTIQPESVSLWLKTEARAIRRVRSVGE